MLELSRCPGEFPEILACKNVARNSRSLAATILRRGTCTQRTFVPSGLEGNGLVKENKQLELFRPRTFRIQTRIVRSQPSLVVVAWSRPVMVSCVSSPDAKRQKADADQKKRQEDEEDHLIALAQEEAEAEADEDVGGSVPVVDDMMDGDAEEIEGDEMVEGA